MRTRVIGIVLVAVAAMFDNAARAGILDIDCDFIGMGHTGGAVDYMWGFDYELQHLTVIEVFSDFSPNRTYVCSVDISGHTDVEEATFHVTQIITNNTTVPWSRYGMSYSAYWPGSPSYEEVTFVDATKLQTVVDRGPYGIELAEPSRVLEGETFTVQFDVHVSAPTGFFYDKTDQGIYTVPEPGTVALFGLGWLGLTGSRGRFGG